MTKAKPQTKPHLGPTAAPHGPGREVSNPLPLALPPVLEVQSMLRDNLGHGGLNPASLERVTIPAGGGLSFTLPTLEGEEDLRSFETVILLYTAQRNFWSKPYTGEDTLPDCSSVDGLTGVGDPGGECHFCPLNAWGSHPSGTSAKACKETRTLYLLRPGELLPITLSVPPWSLSGFNGYVQRLSRAALRYSAARTRFALERTRSGGGIEYARLSLSLSSVLEEGEARWMLEYGAVLKSALEVPMSMAVEEVAAD